MDALVISPHLDDAALSCAVRLRRGDVGMVATIFAGLPAVDAPRSEWDIITKADSARARVSQRRLEDAAAWRSIGVSHLHCDLIEGRADQLDLERLEREIAAVASGFDHVFLPAAIGRHPDHICVRDAGVRALSAAAQITLYGELPYAAFFGWPSHQEYLDVEAYWRCDLASIVSTRRLGTPKLTLLSDDDKVWKQEILAHYGTQLAAVSGGTLALFKSSPMLDYEVEFPLG